MLIMPANQKGWRFHWWAGKYPGRLAHLWSPGGTLTTYPHVNFALDNGCYAAFASGRRWQKDLFLAHCDRVKDLPKKPLWLVVPDAPTEGERTLELWRIWEPTLRPYGIPLAIAVQNGMAPDDLPSGVDVVFVGGDDQWKYQTLADWVATGIPCHVGRVNGSKLWVCDRLGVASCDGTGWFRGDQRQLALLEHYLMCTAGEAEPPATGQFSLLEEETIEQLFWRRQEVLGHQPQWQNRIPLNITREHILKAIEHWTAVPDKHSAKAWVVAHEGQHYPPKLLISRANYWANGCFWPPRNFLGGPDCYAFLRARGFSVVKLNQKLAEIS